MGREVRRVPADWQHPKAFNSHRGETVFVPLNDGARRSYADEAEEWQEGLCEHYGDGEKWGPIEDEYRQMRYTDYAGQRPSPDDYMPDWPEEQRTHLMMYEDTSEGTPISPAFETPEELARWLADTGASAFAGDPAPYEAWLRIAQGGWAPSAVSVDGGPLVSGVEAMLK